MDEMNLEQRVAALESEVASLREQLAALKEAPGSQIVGVTAAQDVPTARAPEPQAVRPTKTPKEPISVADVIAKFGIVLFLLGVSFLLKLTIDYGWLTEPVRVGLGAIVGITLLMTGAVLGDSRRSLGAVLMGGGVVALYATAFAAHGIYHYVNTTVAYILMGGVTVAGVLMALRQNYPSIAVIAALGGVLTPFFLGFDDPTAGVVAIHTAVLMAGFGVIYHVRTWQSTFAAAFLPGWAAMAIAAAANEIIEREVSTVPILVGVLLGVLATTATVGLRKRLTSLDRFLLATVAITMVPMVDHLTNPWVTLGVGVAGGLLLAIIGAAKPGQNATFFTAGAAAVAAATLPLVGVHVAVSTLFALTLAYNLTSWFESDEAGLLRVPGMMTLGALGIWCLIVLSKPVESPTFLNPDGLILLLGTSALFALGWSYKTDGVRWPLFHAATLAFMAMVVHQLSGSTMGEVVATIVWGMLALGLLIAGIARDKGQLQAAGLGAMLLTAGKLLFFDLETVATIWRVVLFMGFGGILLLISFVVAKRGQNQKQTER